MSFICKDCKEPKAVGSIQFLRKKFRRYKDRVLDKTGKVRVKTLSHSHPKKL